MKMHEFHSFLEKNANRILKASLVFKDDAYFYLIYFNILEWGKAFMEIPLGFFLAWG